jgi:ABC-type branched-subunit amino acid transport system permease subunit
VTLGNYVGLYSIVALGLVLLTGVAGQTSFGQAAFVGIGAYTTAILSTHYAMSPWLTLFAGLALTLALALCLGFITLRMKGHYLPLATIAWGISLYFLFGNVEFLGGHTGVSGIPALKLFGIELRNERYFYFLIWGIALGALWATDNLLDSRPGRAVRALRGHIEMAEAFGVDAARLKIVVFVYAALLASISGWLYAHLQRFVNPTPFGINQGIEYLFMAVVGGAGSVWGAVVGATLITLAKQALQDVLPKVLGQSGNFEIVVFGLLMIVLLQRARDGIWPWIARLLPRPVPLPVQDAPALPSRAKAASGRAAARSAWRAQDLRRTRRRQPAVVRDQPRRDTGIDRAERCRQEHDVQPDLRRAGSLVRGDRLRRQVHRRVSAVRDRAPRHRPHVPAREAGSRDERARQRRAWGIPAWQCRRLGRRARAGPCGGGAHQGGSRARDPPRGPSAAHP